MEKNMAVIELKEQTAQKFSGIDIAVRLMVSW